MKGAVWTVVWRLVPVVRCRSILEEGSASPLMSRRLDGLEDVVITGTDMRLALIVRGEGVGRSGWFWLGAAASTSCAMPAEGGRPSSMSSCSLSIVSIVSSCVIIMRQRFWFAIASLLLVGFASSHRLSSVADEPAAPVLLLSRPVPQTATFLPREEETQSNGCYRFL